MTVSHVRNSLKYYSYMVHSRWKLSYMPLEAMRETITELKASMQHYSEVNLVDPIADQNPIVVNKRLCHPREIRNLLWTECEKSINIAFSATPAIQTVILMKLLKDYQKNARASIGQSVNETQMTLSVQNFGVHLPNIPQRPGPGRTNREANPREGPAMQRTDQPIEFPIEYTQQNNNNSIVSAAPPPPPIPSHQDSSTELLGSLDNICERPTAPIENDISLSVASEVRKISHINHPRPHSSYEKTANNMQFESLLDIGENILATIMPSSIIHSENNNNMKNINPNNPNNNSNSKNNSHPPPAPTESSIRGKRVLNVRSNNNNMKIKKNNNNNSNINGQTNRGYEGKRKKRPRTLADGSILG